MTNDAASKLQDKSIIAWILHNKIKTEKGDPVDIFHHRFLYDILRDPAQNLVVTKGAQVGMSTAQILRNHFAAKHKKMDLLYTLPTDNDVNLFVGGKVNRIIANNPCMLLDVADKDSIQQKQVGDSMIYYRGTWTARSAIMVTADRLVHDEIDSCYEPGTEILTRKGWKKVQDIERIDKICTLAQDGRVVFQKPVSTQEYDYEGNLYRFTARSLDIAVTERHRMWARTASKSGFQGGANPYDFHVAPSLMGVPFVMHSRGRWKKSGKSELVSIPRVQTTRMGRQKKSVEMNWPSKKYPAIPFYRFLGWYITEGCVQKKRNFMGRRYTSGTIVITQKGGEEIEDILHTIEGIGHKPKVYKKKRGITQIYFHDPSLAFYLQKLGHSSDVKHLPQRLLYGRKEYLSEFLEATILGDGDSRNVVTTQSKLFADQIQIIALQLGKSASIYYEPKAGVYRVGIVQKPYRRFNGFRNSSSKGKITKETYHGKVYCVTVPNGIVMVRGKTKKLPVWSGNSKLDVIADYQARLQHSKYKQTHVFSHPSLPDIGVDVAWKQSDQKHWFIKCPHCNKWQYLDWNTEDPAKMSVDLQRSIFVCKKCGGEIDDETRRTGKWVRKYNEAKYSGYWVPLLIAPWVSAKDIAAKWQDVLDGQQTPDFFHNKVLGLPYADAASKLIYSDFIQNLTGEAYAPPQQDRIVIGIDTGLRLDYVMGNEKGLFYHGDCDDYDELDRQMERWPRAIAVIDQGGDLIGSRKFAERWQGRVYLCALTGEMKGKELVKWGKGDESGSVRADRNRMIQLVVGEFRNKRIAVHGTENDWYEYYQDWNNLSRIKKLHPETNHVTGYQWVRSGRDHRAMSTIFFRVGMRRFSGTGSLSLPMEENRPNSYMVNPDQTVDMDPKDLFRIGVEKSLDALEEQEEFGI